MPREIKKKILDSASSGGASSIEAKDQAEGMKRATSTATDFMSSPSKLDSADSNAFFKPQGGKKLDSGFEFSLDDFDTPDTMTDVGIPRQPELQETSELPETGSGSAQPAEAKAGKPHSVKTALMAAACVLPILVGLIVFKYWRSTPETPKQTIVTKVIRPIVVPNYQEKLEFLVLTSPPSERNLLIMNLELRFSDVDRHARFLENTVLIRDHIFNFLATKHPNRNSEGDWRKIIGAELADYLRNVVPESRADAVQLARLSKL